MPLTKHYDDDDDEDYIDDAISDEDEMDEDYLCNNGPYDGSPISMETWKNSIVKFRRALHNKDNEGLNSIYNQNSALIIAYYREDTIHVTESDRSDVTKKISFTEQMSDLFQLIVISSKNKSTQKILMAIWRNNQSMHSNINSLHLDDTKWLLINVITTSRNIRKFAVDFLKKFNDNLILSSFQKILQKRSTDNSHRQADKIAKRLALKVEPQPLTRETQEKIGFVLGARSQIQYIIDSWSLVLPSQRQARRRGRPARPNPSASVPASTRQALNATTAMQNTGTETINSQSNKRPAEQPTRASKRQKFQQNADVAVAPPTEICEGLMGIFTGIPPTNLPSFPQADVAVAQPTESDLICEELTRIFEDIPPTMLLSFLEAVPLVEQGKSTSPLSHTNLFSTVFKSPSFESKESDPTPR